MQHAELPFVVFYSVSVVWFMRRKGFQKCSCFRSFESLILVALLEIVCSGIFPCHLKSIYKRYCLLCTEMTIEGEPSSLVYLNCWAVYLRHWSLWIHCVRRNRSQRVQMSEEFCFFSSGWRMTQSLAERQREVSLFQLSLIYMGLGVNSAISHRPSTFQDTRERVMKPQFYNT